MIRFLDRCGPLLFAVLRIVASSLFFLHGTQKLFGTPPMPGGGAGTIPLLSLIGLAGMIECVAGPLIGLGLFAREAAFLASGEMAFAYFLGHVPRSPWPTLSGGETPILNCFLFLYIAAVGPGILSLDSLRKTRKRR